MSRKSTKPARRLPLFPICSQGAENCSHIGSHGGCGPRNDDERRRVECWKMAVMHGIYYEPRATTVKRYFGFLDAVLLEQP